MSPAANPPPVSDAIFNRRLALLVLASFLIFAAAVVVRLGISATPYEATDSVGRTMGFNDPLSAEHFAIMIRNFSPTNFLRIEHAYDWLLFAMQAAGAGLLLAAPRVSVRATRWFFASQAAIFPLGLMFCWLPPVFAFGIFTSSMDREGFIDIPFIPAVAQGTWVLTSLILLFALRGPGLGLAKVWHAVRESARACGRTFVETVR